MPSIVALIPARSGSTRIKDKNIVPLNCHPLIAYTIAADKSSGIFDDIIVSTDSDRYARISEQYGARIPSLRPKELAGATSPDIDWVYYTLKQLRTYDCFAILRPTSPFRTKETIQRAWHLFMSNTADSLRAVERCSQHPAKMWATRFGYLLPIMPYAMNGTPWHDTPYQSLPPVYAQNASLEIAWSRIVLERQTISGSSILAFHTQGYEGFDINTPMDLEFAEFLAKEGRATLPPL